MMLVILFSMQTMELFENRLKPYAGVALLFSMKTESLVSLQSCHSNDAGNRCKQSEKLQWEVDKAFDVFGVIVCLLIHYLVSYYVVRHLNFGRLDFRVTAALSIVGWPWPFLVCGKGIGVIY